MKLQLQINIKLYLFADVRVQYDIDGGIANVPFT